MKKEEKMKKILACFAVLAAMILMISCGGASCSWGERECRGNDSYFCGGNSDNPAWVYFESCASGCDTSMGYCKPWTDPDTNLTWSYLQTFYGVNDGFGVSSGLTWYEATEFCRFGGWRLPNIDELRTLIQKCPGTVTGGLCPVSERNDCLSYQCGEEDCFCPEPHDDKVKYSKLGDTRSFWSSSAVSNLTDSAWVVDFGGSVSVKSSVKDTRYSVRCVR